MANQQLLSQVEGMFFDTHFLRKLCMLKTLFFGFCWRYLTISNALINIRSSVLQ